jgi:hypothetical protein
MRVNFAPLPIDPNAQRPRSVSAGVRATLPGASGTSPGRIDMRRLGALATAALLLTVTTTPVWAAAPSSGFLGSWSSIDPVDGSRQHLTIMGGNGHVQMRYVDEFATTCVLEGAPTVVFTGVLTGTIAGNELGGWWKNASCGPKLVLKAPYGFAWFFEYDPNTDTLWGATNDGPATWSRD